MTGPEDTARRFGRRSTAARTTAATRAGVAALAAAAALALPPAGWLGAPPADAQVPAPTPTATPTATTTPAPTASPTPTPEPTPVPPPPGDPVVAAVGDIACSPNDPNFNGGAGTERTCRQQATSDLVMTGGFTAALILGDAQYETATYEDFLGSYDPSWGRLLGITYPAIGNHEYFDERGEGYFDYFNGRGAFSGRAGDRDKAYYSFDIGSWHVVALNSLCHQIGGCGPGSPQERWLVADLAAHPAPCTLVMWHHPPHTSSGVGWPSMRTLWQALYDAGADVLLTGHAHNYERFAPMDALGRVDPAQGLRQFVAGMGGKSLSRHSVIRAQSEARDSSRFGVLAMTLRPGSYDWRFVPATPGTFEDAGTSACHGPPPPVRATAATGSVRASRTSAVLRAGVDPGRQATTYRFEYGRSPRLGSKTAEAPLPAATGMQPVSAVVRRLKPGTRYHYRVVATNASGVRVGARRSFTAPRRPSAYAGTILRTAGVRAFWRLDDRGGDLVFDDVAARLGWSSGSDWSPAPGAIVGDASTAAEFDGAGRSAVVEGPSVSTDATLEGWFRWREGSVLLRDDSASGGWFMGWESRGRLAYRVGGRGYATERQIQSVRDGAWHHLALTKAGPVVQVFVDGQRVHYATDAPSTPSTSPWHIMRNGPLGGFASGSADEVAIYDRALDPTEVLRHYEAGVAGRQPDTTVAGPAGPTNDPTPSFESVSSERRSAFRCALSPAGRQYPVFGACPGRRTYRRLQDGTYTFAAYAIDAGGHPDPVPVSQTFTVDTVVPEVVLGPLDQTLSDVRRRGLRAGATCSEACTVLASVTVEGALARALGGRPGQRVEIARGSVRAAAGAAVTVVARLDRRRARRLARRTKLPVRVEISGTDPAGNVRPFVTRLTLTDAAPPPPPPPPPPPGTPAPPAPPAPTPPG